MKRLIKFIKRKRSKVVILVAILFLAAFLRLWGIWRLDLFTYDQARDATYIKRILADREIRLIGPQSSLPGISLGPAYYYLMALPLLVFNFNPIGIDLAIVLGGVATVWLLFKVLEKKTSPLAALLVCLLYATSPIVVELSRRAWNPSLVPLFLILIVYSLIKIVDEEKNIFFSVLMASLAIIIQLHYSTLLILPALFLIFLVYREKFLINKSYLLIGLLIFLFLISPLLVFNLRHQWLMFKSIYRVVQGSTGDLDILIGLKNALVDVWHLFEGLLLINLRPWSFGIFAFVLLVNLMMFVKRKFDTLLKFALVFLFVGVIGSQLYPEGFSFFYYIFLFPVPFIILAYLLEFLLKTYPSQKSILILLVVVLAGWQFFQTGKIIFRPPVRIWQDFVLVANVIANDKGTDKKFNLAAIYKSPGEWENYYRRGIVREDIRWDHNAVDYGYFVELRGKKPLPWDSFREAEILYLIAETPVKEPSKVKFWEIDQFAPKNVVSQWELENETTIYKLEK